MLKTTAEVRRGGDPKLIVRFLSLSHPALTFEVFSCSPCENKPYEIKGFSNDSYIQDLDGCKATQLHN